MARLLQVFGFLSVLFRGATLTFQSLAIGGIVFLIFVVRRAKEDSEALQQACLRWIRCSALVLAMMQISYVLANSIILRQSADMSLREVLGANFVLAGVIGIVAAFTVIALTSPTRSTGYTDLLLPAAAIIASSVMTSHSMARLDYRAPLVAFTALHQAATATWLGGLPYLLIAIREAPSPECARQLSARFSQLALVSVAVLASAGFALSLAYVGSVKAVYGTSYGAMVATKVLLFGLLLFLGALNFQSRVQKSSPGCLLALQGSPARRFKSCLKTLTPHRKRLSKPARSRPNPTFPAKPERAQTPLPKRLGPSTTTIGQASLFSRSERSLFSRKWRAFLGRKTGRSFFSAWLFFFSCEAIRRSGLSAPTVSGLRLQIPRCCCIESSFSWLSVSPFSNGACRRAASLPAVPG